MENKSEDSVKNGSIISSKNWTKNLSTLKHHFVKNKQFKRVQPTIIMPRKHNCCCHKPKSSRSCIKITQADIGTNGFILNKPGNYCLAENIVYAPSMDFLNKAAIMIASDNVQPVR